MKHSAIAVVIAALLVASCAHAALEMNRTPPPLLAQVLAGDGAGSVRSVVSQQGPYPYAVVFVQRADDHLARFVKALDEFVTSKEANRLAAYVVVWSAASPSAEWLAALKADCPLKHVSVCIPAQPEQIPEWQPQTSFPTNAWFFNESVLAQRWVVSSPLTSNLAGRMKATITRALAPKRASEASGCNCK